ncbi:MAG: hypothetical protein BMS9Abin05_1969 [Rhodothermia bacterium]|nr:MAG: hypothetical protein BMS9Abin05_1969 [Rhodothermia bacterium]
MHSPGFSTRTKNCFVLACFLAFWISQDSFARQEQSGEDVVVQWDEAEQSIVDGVEIIRLINARVRQGETFLRADRMTDEGANVRLFTGNVQIVERGDTVYADVLRYDSDTKVGYATGTVHMTDGAVSLHSTSAAYYSDEKRTEFDAGVQYADSLTLLTAHRGVYWSEDSRAVFSGDVRLRQNDLYVEADSVSYSREDDVFFAEGNVVIDRLDGEPEDADRASWVGPTNEILGFLDADARSLLFSDSVRHDGKVDSSWVSGRVLLLRTQNGASGTDSLMVMAQSMILSRSAEGDNVIARDSVSVVETNFSVMGDSLVYDRLRSDQDDRLETRMFGDPIAWLADSQISADSLQVWGKASANDSLLASGNVFVASLDTTINRIQQLKGKSLNAYFESDTLKTMKVSPNAEALYYIEPDPGEPTVAIHSTADRIEFTFEEGAIMDVRAVSGVRGTFYPENLIDRAQNLAGYTWQPDRRPKRKTMLEELSRRNTYRIGRKRSTIVLVDPIESENRE